jgi:threonine dehydratase
MRIEPRPPLATRPTHGARAELFFKCENFQRMGAFKFAGAFTTRSRASTTQARGGCVAFSSGNHAQSDGAWRRACWHARRSSCRTTRPRRRCGDARLCGEVVVYDRYRETRGIGAAWRTSAR